MEGDARAYAGKRRRCHPYGRNLHAHVHRVHGRGSPAFVLEVPQLRLVQRGETLEGRSRAWALCACDACAVYPELQPVPVFPVLGRKALLGEGVGHIFDIRTPLIARDQGRN